MPDPHPYEPTTGRGGTRRPNPDDLTRARMALDAAAGTPVDTTTLPRAHRPSLHAVTVARCLLNNHPHLADQVRNGQLSIDGARQQIRVMRRNQRSTP